MKVAHRGDYDTHAVIGGKDIEEFSIAQTAEFFTVLSNTLYSDKPLAVVREIICNAWDAQIVAGTTHLPLVVNIDEDKFSIRDFGHGIPHDMIHSVYCVYGNSTKENDGNQTGGFGLGSKAPFAYSDHFTVVNHYGGTKAVHAISRGSSLTQGKPDRRVMVTSSTTETGVEVIIPVKNIEDTRIFTELVTDIAAFGEMNVLLNGVLVEIVPISTAENNFFLTTRKPKGSYDKINIRYGNVVYPLKPDGVYSSLHYDLMQRLDAIPAGTRDRYTNKNSFVLILQAPANSISVTPSREALSNTETTAKTVRLLLGKAIDTLNVGNALFSKLLFEQNAKAVDHMFDTNYQERVFFSPNLFTDPFGPNKDSLPGRTSNHQISNMSEYAKYYMEYSQHIPSFTQRGLETQKAQIMLDRGWRNPRDIKSYLKIVKTHNPVSTEEHCFQKLILRPILKKLAVHPTLRHTALKIVTKGPRHKRDGWTDLASYIPRSDDFLKLLQGVVVVTHSKLVYEEHWNRLSNLKDTVPLNTERMVYLAPRGKNHKDEAIAFFQKLGYRVVDFAALVDEEQKNSSISTGKSHRVSASKKHKTLGLALLQDNLCQSSKLFVRNQHLVYNSSRSEDYTHVIKPMALSDRFDKRFFPWGDNCASQITTLFGSTMGICVSETQLQSQIKKGFGDGLTHIMKTITDKVLGSSDIRQYDENLKGIQGADRFLGPLISLAKISPILRKAFELPLPVNETDLVYYTIFKSMEDSFPYARSGSFEDGSWEKMLCDTSIAIAKWEATTAYENLSERAQMSKGLRFLDLQDMEYLLSRLDKIHPNYNKKVFIETTIINALNLRN
jgi:hypothetical protein